MITSINEFKNNMKVNEVRLPDGYFKILKNFYLPISKDNQDIVFNKDQIVHIDTTNKKIFAYNTNINEQVDKDVDYFKLMHPDNYKIFKDNSERTIPNPEILPKQFKPETEDSFTVSVKRLNNKIQSLNLNPDTKLKITIL